MAKAKKTEEAIASVPALVVTPEKAPVVSGNFEQIEAYLQKWKKQVSKMEITEDNIEQVRLIKKEAVAYRNSLTKIQNDTKRIYFNDPKAVFEAKMGQLLGVVGEVETAADSILEIEEKQRVADINQVLDGYKEKFQEQYKLTEQNLARVEYKKNYYNKTAEEKERKTDLEQQFKDLRKEQDAHAANVRLITATCKEEPRLNLQHWIDRLQTDDVASITEAIIAEKQRLRELDTQQTETVTSAASGSDGDVSYDVVDDAEQNGEKITIGVPSHIDFSTDFPGRRKQMRIEFDYACDQGDALSEYFEEQRQYLKQFGIKIKAVTKEAVF
jgi:hypothetical protein